MQKLNSDTKIEFLKGVGPKKAAVLNDEIQVFTFGDLLSHYPFRYEDRSKIYEIAEITEDLPFVQIRGKIIEKNETGSGHKARLSAMLRDRSGMVELIWFKGVKWVNQRLQTGKEYIVFGRPTLYGRRFNIPHPEFEEADTYTAADKNPLVPVYNTTEKMKKAYLESKQLGQLIKHILTGIYAEIPENLSAELVGRFRLMSRAQSLVAVHFPKDNEQLIRARKRLKFEEFFFLQLSALRKNLGRKRAYSGQVFNKTELLSRFYKDFLPFELTGAQKRVIREIYQDMCSGRQMNRLLQGDVGSGKTITAFICMLTAIDKNAQTCLMAPTEILADQHYRGLKVFADMLGLPIRKLTGSSKTSERREIAEGLESGTLPIIVGTHALLEDKVKFKNLGLCVIDEQHRFGVEQRSKLWEKRSAADYPHILVMTATPIPRTLAMSVYGDLDISVIDEMPAGRKPIETMHKYDSNRLYVFGFMRDQIKEGRQIYVVYPLIDESEHFDYKNLMDGYESVCRAFPDLPISIVHGKMKSEAKDYEMQRFVKGETKIMVATTVIEVGVNVPNASVMVIENAEKFGLAQLHQLRGRVGRGADQSYCILMTAYKLSKEARERLKIMVKTNNGFEISEADLKMRGPGEMAGTRQSGLTALKIGDLVHDRKIIEAARESAVKILEADPDLRSEENLPLRRHLLSLPSEKKNWENIS